MENIIFAVGADFAYRSFEAETESIIDNKEEYSLLVIMPGLGIKYYLYEEDFSPFIIGTLKKGIPVIINFKSDLRTEDEIAEENDEFSFSIGGGLDFSVKESLLLGFEFGMYVLPLSSESTLSKINSISISTYSGVTMTYLFQ